MWNERISVPPARDGREKDDFILECTIFAPPPVKLNLNPHLTLKTNKPNLRDKHALTWTTRSIRRWRSAAPSSIPWWPGCPTNKWTRSVCTDVVGLSAEKSLSSGNCLSTRLAANLPRRPSTRPPGCPCYGIETTSGHEPWPEVKYTTQRREWGRKIR